MLLWIVVKRMREKTKCGPEHAGVFCLDLSFHDIFNYPNHDFRFCVLTSFSASLSARTTLDTCPTKDILSTIYIYIYISTAETKWPPYSKEISNCIFMIENGCMLVKIVLKFVHGGPIDKKSVLVRIMAWRQPGDNPLAGPILTLYIRVYISSSGLKEFKSTTKLDKSPGVLQIGKLHGNIKCFQSTLILRRNLLFLTARAYHCINLSMQCTLDWLAVIDFSYRNDTICHTIYNVCASYLRGWCGSDRSVHGGTAAGGMAARILSRDCHGRRLQWRYDQWWSIWTLATPYVARNSQNRYKV